MISRSIMASVMLTALMACVSNDVIFVPPVQSSIVVSVTIDGSLSVDGLTVDAATVKRMSGGNPVILQGGPGLQFPQFQKALNELQGLDIPIAILGEDSQ